MKNTHSMFCGITVSFVLGFLFLAGCANHPKSETNPTEYPNVRYEITVSENGYGYKIYMDEDLYISQPSIPGLSGTAGFESEADARKTAELAISKIKQGIIPPTITLEELEKNGIIINSIPFVEM